jgi:hypothetical protein
MLNSEALEIVGMLDEVIRSRRGAALFPGGVPTNLAIVWINEVEKFHDPGIATRAVADLYVASGERPPTVEDLKQAYRAIAKQRLAAKPSIDEGEFVRELENWLKGWLVARAAGDERVWPEQKIGYDELQSANHSYRTYVWPDQDEMPDEKRAEYEKRGETLTAAEAGEMLGAGVGFSL